MNEFKKLSWRIDANDSELSKEFLSEEAVSSLYTYKSFDNPLKARKRVKIKVSNVKYVPGLKEFRLIKRRSLLTKSEKSHCLKALKLIQMGKRQDLLTQNEKYSLDVFNKCQGNIMEENRLFNECVKGIWVKFKSKQNKIAPGIYSYSWNNWKKKLSRYLDYPQYYNEESTISLTFDENESSIDFQHVVQPLEIGTLARYAHTTLKEECILKLNTLAKLVPTEQLYSKLPVSQDDNVIKLAEKYNFDVAISSSALKQLIDYTDVKNKWTIPVIINEVNGKKIVFIDKVLPKTEPTYSDLNIHCYKKLLKLHFCQYEAFSYPEKETPIDNTLTATDESEDNINEAKDLVIHHNVNYRIWSIKKTTIQNTLLKNVVKDKDINLLVRCKLDACEDTEQGALIPVILRPKLEQQVHYGVNVSTKSELAHDWTSLFFRLFSVLYRSRINTHKKEIISIEKCSIQKINTEAQTCYRYKPILGLGVLQKILSHLVNLDVGSYLLHHLPKHEAFVAVLKHCDGAENGFDLHAESLDASVDADTQSSWLPIDVNYLLPAHEELNTIPGLFDGFDTEQKGKVTKKKKKGKKKKKAVTID